MTIKLKFATRDQLDQIQEYCERRLINSVGDMLGGYGDPLNDVLKYSEILKTLATMRAKDDVEVSPGRWVAADKIEYEPTPGQKKAALAKKIKAELDAA